MREGGSICEGGDGGEGEGGDAGGNKGGIVCRRVYKSPIVL